MQEEALSSLESLRVKGKSKALLISATGTGKTFLSAFDVKRVKARKLLFIVHRRDIAEKSKTTFKKLFDATSMGLLSGDTKGVDRDFIFTTIQTISKDDNLTLFTRDYFDYIVIDETHRAGANSYTKILSYC